MNDLLAPFIRISNAHTRVLIEHNSNQYEAFIGQKYNIANNISSYKTEERKYETKINIKVLGYLIGDDKNQNTPKIVYRENAVDVKIGRERVIVIIPSCLRSKLRYALYLSKISISSILLS